MKTQSFVGLILAVLVLVIGVTLTETVVDSAQSILDTDALSPTEGDSEFPLVKVLIPFIPVIYIAAVLGLAGAIGYYSARSRGSA